jgi:hypothetical protein
MVARRIAEKQKTKNFKQMEKPLTPRDPSGLVMVQTAMSPRYTTRASRNE